MRVRYKNSHKSNFSLYRAIFCIILLLIFGFFSFSEPAYSEGKLRNNLGIWFNFTESYPMGLYRQVLRKVRRGDLVVFCLSFQETVRGLERNYLVPGKCEHGAKPLIKKVYAKTGDFVQMHEEAIQIDDKYFSNLKPLSVDSQGRILNPKYGKYLTSNDQLWVFSDYIKNSWDSRYFGPIDRSNVIAVVEPLLVF